MAEESREVLRQEVVDHPEGAERNGSDARVGHLDTPRSMCLRQAKLGKGGRDVRSTQKPFVGTLRVKARPVASDQRLEASLASNGATQATKRRPRVRKPCYGASKDLSREPLLYTYQGPRCGTVSVWCPRSCRRRRPWQTDNGGSPGTWEQVTPPSGARHLQGTGARAILSPGGVSVGSTG